MPKKYFTPTLFGVTLLGIVNCGSSASSGDGTGDQPTAGASGSHPSGTGGASPTGTGGVPAVAGTNGLPAAGSNGLPTAGAAGSLPGGLGGGGATSSGGSPGAAGLGMGGAAMGGSAAGGAAGTNAGGTSAGGNGGGGGPCDVWVAPDGNDANPGSYAAPVLTPQHAYDLVCPGVAGSVNGNLCSGTRSTLCLKAGTYNLSTRIEFKKTRMGTESRIITMMADPAASTKPILNFAGQPRLACGENPADKNIYGIDIGADWYRVKGLEVENANDSGILVQGAHDFVEDCVVHGSEDTGVLVNSSSGFTGSGTYATIKNVDSYQNIDKRCNGANADGFGVKKGVGVGNVFDGCRAWDNADDGYDLYAWESPVTIKNSWAFNQGATYSGSESNGNGFKMGGNKVSAKHVMSNLFGFYNNGNGGHKADWGFTNNSNPASMTCTGCGAWNNTGGAFQNIAHTGDVSANATPAKAAAAKRNADGSLPDITKL